MPTIKIELDHAQYGWLQENTKDIGNFIRRLISEEMSRTPSSECSGLYRLVKPVEEGNKATPGLIIAMAREYVNTCRAAFGTDTPTHRYSQGGADLFSIAVPQIMRGPAGELPIDIGNGTRLINMTFSTWFGEGGTGRLVGFCLKMADLMHRTVTLKGSADASDAQCDELAGIFGREWNGTTGAYARKGE